MAQLWRGTRVSLGDCYLEDLLSGEELDSDLDMSTIVVPFERMTIVIDYPLTDEARYEHTQAGAFTRADLLRAIALDYDKTYAEEYATRHIAYRSDPGPDALNAGTTNGRYGIWGYDLDELRILAAYVNGNGEVTLEIDTI